MNIYYSPFFDSHSHLDVETRGRAMLGTLVCGTMSLLSQLELRCGIVAPQQSEQERMVDYQHALADVADKTIFAESFKTDEIGVSRQVMAWCDSLAMAGWTPEMTDGASDKLRSLAMIAQGVKIKGAAQRWNDVYDYVKQHRILADDDTIEVCAPREAIPVVVRRVLEAIGKKSATEAPHPMGLGDLKRVQSVLLGGEAEQLQHDDSVVVHRFKHRDEAYQWYLLSDAGRDCVTVSSDNRLLNDLAEAIGKPSVDSTSSDSNPQVLQLFKLGLSLFARPLSVNNLLSYLRVPGHPAGGVASKLAEVLVKEGGINQAWHDTIKDYDFTDDKGKDKRSERMKYLKFITNPGEDIITKEVAEYANDLAHWTDKQMRSDHVAPQRKEQLAVLAAYCRALSRSLKDKEELTPDELQQLVNGIYQPHSFTHHRAMRSSAETIASPMQLVDPTRSLCWLGCVDNEMPLYPYDFVNTNEHQWLSNQDVTLPSRTEHYQLHQQMLHQALERVTQRLTLVIWDYDGNTRVEEHPIVTQLATAFKKLGWQTDTPSLPQKEVTVTQLKPHDSYEVGDLLKGHRRDKESQTSIDKLIQHPFDYVMEYHARLHEPGDAQIADLEITQGNVAHRVVEQIVNSCLEKGDKTFALPSKEKLENCIDKAIMEKGAILLLPENKIACTNFKAKLKESLSTLADIIHIQKLHLVGSEVELQVDLPEIGPFEAKIDLLLKDSQGHYVIFDLKWTMGKHRTESLEKNTALQLELYRQALKEKNNLGYDPRVAYYLLPQCKLVTADTFAPHSAIQQVKVDAARVKQNPFEEIKASVLYRRNELDRGHIEESELRAITDIPCAQQQGLFPLEDEKKKKKGPYVSRSKKRNKKWDKATEPKQTATTHPIFKNRLQ